MGSSAYMKQTLALHASNLYPWSRLHFSKAMCEQQAEKQKGTVNANADNAQQSSASFNTEKRCVHVPSLFHRELLTVVLAEPFISDLTRRCSPCSDALQSSCCYIPSCQASLRALLQQSKCAGK